MLKLSLTLAAMLLAPLATAAAPLNLAPTGDPLIETTDAVADYDPFFDLLTIDAIAPTGSASLGALPVLGGFSVFGSLAAPFATLDVFADADPVDPILSGSLVRSGTDGTVLELLFETTSDETGLFGPRLLMLLETGAAEPLDGFSAFPTTAQITTPIPLPPSAALLGSALLAGWIVRRLDRKAAPSAAILRRALLRRA